MKFNTESGRRNLPVAASIETPDVVRQCDHRGERWCCTVDVDNAMEVTEGMTLPYRSVHNHLVKSN